MGHVVLSQNHILKLLLSIGLGYMRWTQLTPMLLLWGFGLLMLLALTFVNFKEQTISALVFILEWLLQLPLVGERITPLLSDDSPAYTFPEVTSIHSCFPPGPLCRWRSC
jgi:hypothetical protein